jgi:tyrosyl-tRNA synthetase
MIHILSKYSITQIIEKEDFKNRLNRKNSIGLHEIIYPIIQAYDSVVLNPDIEIGGSDQLFNLLIGRNLMKKFKMIKQCIITTPLIEGINANFKNGKISGEKMSKSLNNSISLNNSSTEKFGKIMSVCDQLMYKYYNLLLGKNINNNNKFKNIHPMHIKKKLAMKIIRFTNNNKNIIYAYDQFNYLFSKKKNKNIYSNNLPIFRFKKKRKTLIEILISTKICKSNTIARKLIISGAIKINNKKILNAKFSSFNKINVIKIGKKKWIKLITN